MDHFCDRRVRGAIQGLLLVGRLVGDAAPTRLFPIPKAKAPARIARRVPYQREHLSRCVER
eukprot:scaffold16206_cov134-Isochrysis_galbana.AAC.3